MAYNTTRGSYSHRRAKGVRRERKKERKGFRQCCPKTYANVGKNIWSAVCLRLCPCLHVHLASIVFDLIGTCASWSVKLLVSVEDSDKLWSLSTAQIQIQMWVASLGLSQRLTESADRRHNKNAEGNKDDDKVSLTLRFMPQQQRQRQHLSVKIQILSWKRRPRTSHCALCPY